jgi:predicted nucleic acid-binding protein
MNLIDSSFWLEYVLDSPMADLIDPIIKNTGELIVPAITIYEVTKKLLLEKDEEYALTIASQMKHCRVIDLDSDLAIFAATIGKEYQLPLADSIIYATALKYQSILWTMDQHFSDLPGVRYFSKS